MGALILIIEDEPLQQMVLSTGLQGRNHRLEFAATVEEGITAALELEPDVILLDLGLPDGSGLDVLRRIRGVSQAYVIVVSAHSDEADRLMGLAAGADDYVCKPFSVRELEMRIEAMLRRPRMPGVTASEPATSALHIDRRRRIATAHGNQLDLTRLEFDLLATLHEHAGMVLSRRQLLETVWGPDFFDDRTVVSHLSNLRGKLADCGLADILVTVRGVGYRLEPALAG